MSENSFLGKPFALTLPGDIRFGAGRAGEAAGLAAAAADGGGVLLVTGSSDRHAAPLRERLGELGATGTTVRVVGEPSVDVVREAVGTARAAGVTAVLAVGGGSVLDTAKAVAALVHNGDPLDHLEVVGHGRPLTGPVLPWIAVPTTAGTGSEVTRNAVLTAGRVKVSLRSPAMLARTAVVDPDLLRGLPRAPLVHGGLDALVQLVEPLVSKRANPVTDALARQGLSASLRSLPRAAAEGTDDPAVREDLSLASLLGGICLANAGLGAVHGLAGVAGGMLGAPHGALCAAFLPATLEADLVALRRAPDPVARARFDALGPLVTGDPEAGAEQAVAALGDLVRALGVPRLDDLGLVDDEVGELVEGALSASSTKANPLPLTRDEMRAAVLASR
ncbi:iron-containing alcohol dehydrogenase [Kineosporia sp. J2-2]|uniref:Iron-containing alcohol dehydrogenase n=1 Tax=Kineosporia corallincola TaxID=2835133 RepID=A0ABS5TK65_9ACTN|nr:iron-containing alcohol dehydrogenase [Kineosporia corallincola]MBT0771499.1 iron-containing alcohol dehydrogenase [Kineosporia corallincola]